MCKNQRENSGEQTEWNEAVGNYTLTACILSLVSLTHTLMGPHTAEALFKVKEVAQVVFCTKSATFPLC